MDNLHQIIDESQPELIETLKRWISKPSIKSAAEEGAPFGAQVKLALETALADAQALGFETRSFDNYAGDIRMGPTGVDPLGILAHLDVVPVGDGWTVEPFAGIVE